MTKILVVEDDPTVRALILKLLKAEGFEVISGEDGQVGIDLARAYEPDLIICDIMMPECNGYEVLEQLRQDPHTARIPFIFLSAKADRTDLRQGMELGADDYLTKPFKRAELLGAISARLAKQSAITQPYIDEMKRAAQNLSQMAYRDPLTNLPNRILLHNHLQDALKRATRENYSVAVMCLNLHRFKAINRTLGYSTGDLLLKQAAERLLQAFDSTHTVARLGGDEFCLLLNNLGEPEDIAIAADSVLQILTEPYNLDGNSVPIQASIGIALYPRDGNTPDKLLNRADTAMRHGKTHGLTKPLFYRPEMDTLLAERQALENKLHVALERQELVVYYQPVVNLITRRIIGAEALIRWQQPELGIITPDKFIPIAEDTGLIVPIGEWVLRTACTQAKQWLSTQPALRIAVNLSARQFKQNTLTNMVATVLQDTTLPADHLMLELTETCVMENVETTVTTLKALRDMGVKISIDDFGTGYSSLNYLRLFPIDTLKIDRSFVSDITQDANSAAIAKAIIALAQTLQLKVTAEGVETMDQFSFLRQNGCQSLQGYVFSPPVPPEAFEQLLIEDKRL